MQPDDLQNKTSDLTSLKNGGNDSRNPNDTTIKINGESDSKSPTDASIKMMARNSLDSNTSNYPCCSTGFDITQTDNLVTPPDDIQPKYLELLLACQEHADHFRNDDSEKGRRLYRALTNWQPCIVVANKLVLQVQTFVHCYDFDDATPGNGYRSFISVTNACIDYSLAICRALLAARAAVFFRKKFYMKEVEACSQLLCSLNNCLRYLLILHDWSKDTGDLFGNGIHSAEELFEAGDAINQYCFYGRCLGFQYSDAIRNIMRFISIGMAGFSETFYARDIDNPLLKTTRNVWSSGKYLLNPEMRARRIVNLSQNANIDFCKSFWFLAESEVIHRIPSLVGSSIKINQVIEIPSEALQLPKCLPLSDNIELVDIPVPQAHLGTGIPVTVRLLSRYRRQGMLGLGPKGGFRSWRKLHPHSPGILFHCHGGGFVAQSSKSHELYLRDWAVALDTPILSVDYSLAPEAPFPRAIEEVFYAYCWMLRNAEHLGTTAERIVLMGDSAGANLCIAVALKCIEKGIRIPDGIFLAYCPTLINFTPSPARMLCLMDPLLPFGFMMRCLRAYAAPTPECQEANSKSEALLKKILKANAQEPHYKLNLNDTLNGNLSKLPSANSSAGSSSPADNSKWQQIMMVNSIPDTEIAIDTLDDGNADSSENTFASASYHSQTLERTDVPSIDDDNSSLLSFEDDSQPIEHYPISIENENIPTEQYIEQFINTYILEEGETEEATEQTTPTIETMQATTPTEERLLTDVGRETVDGLQKKFQQALHSISNTFNRITQSYDIKPDGITTDEQTVADLRNIDALIARSPSEEFAFQVPKDPFLSPYYASDEWLRQMPNTKIITIEMDPCLDDCVMFAKKLKALNRPVTLDILKGLPHGFLNFTMISSEAMEGSKRCIELIRQLLDLESVTKDKSAATSSRSSTPTTPTTLTTPPPDDRHQSTKNNNKFLG